MLKYAVVELIDGQKIIMESVSHIEDQTFIRISNRLIIGAVDKNVELDDGHDAMIFVFRRGDDDVYYYMGDITFDTNEHQQTRWQVYLYIEDAESLGERNFDSTSYLPTKYKPKSKETVVISKKGYCSLLQIQNRLFHLANNFADYAKFANWKKEAVQDMSWQFEELEKCLELVSNTDTKYESKLLPFIMDRIELLERRHKTFTMFEFDFEPTWQEKFKFW